MSTVRILYIYREQEEQMRAQQEILDRRKNPKAMRKYDEAVEERRKGLAEERAVYNFQKKNEDGYDAITDWKRLKDEGKIKIGKDLERNKDTSRLGSEGLIEVRVDERMPYIDQGYVDESASNPMEDLMNFFRKKK